MNGNKYFRIKQYNLFIISYIHANYSVRVGSKFVFRSARNLALRGTKHPAGLI